MSIVKNVFYIKLFDTHIYKLTFKKCNVNIKLNELTLEKCNVNITLNGGSILSQI